MIKRLLDKIKGFFAPVPGPQVSSTVYYEEKAFKLFRQLVANGLFSKDLSFASKLFLFVAFKDSNSLHVLDQPGNEPARFVVVGKDDHVQVQCAYPNPSAEEWITVNAAMTELLEHLASPKYSLTPGMTQRQANMLWDRLVDEFLMTWNSTSPISEQAFLETACEALSPAFVQAKLHEWREVIAMRIYNQWSKDPEFTPWVVGGNSHKQNQARQQARELKILYVCLQIKRDMIKP